MADANLDSIKQFPHFETQSADEEVIVFSRAHFFTNVWWIVLVIILLLIPSALKLVEFKDNPFDLALSAGSQFILTLAWYLFVISFAFQRFLLWFFNIYIITNKRVVDIDFYHLFYKEISSTTISHVQDVTHRRGGVAQLLFDYGDLFIQTAGTTPNFEFHAIPKPGLVQKKLIALLKGVKMMGLPD